MHEKDKDLDGQIEKLLNYTYTVVIILEVYDYHLSLSNDGSVTLLIEVGSSLSICFQFYPFPLCI